MKPETHIPDEVVEAGVRKFIASYHPEPADTPVSRWVNGEWVKVGPMWKVEFAEPFRAALTAALAEWVRCGMAREGAAYPPAVNEENWVATDYPAEMRLAREGKNLRFPVLIIRTEAP